MGNVDDNYLNQHQIYFAKSDLRSAFKILPILPTQRHLLIYKAKHPVSRKMYWFVEKTLPFGASISCAKFQLFSDSLRHILEYATGQHDRVTNYLDDFLFIARDEQEVNQLVRDFLAICEQIGCPVALDKTEWGTTSIVFLGVLLNGRRHCLALPDDKILKAIRLLKLTCDAKKMTVKMIQRLAGTLNFLCKAIIPGRTFTRSMYEKLKIVDSKGSPLKPYHHVNINQQFKFDCGVWQIFLENASANQLCRPFIDLTDQLEAVHLNFATDATLNPNLGMGGIFQNRWFAQKWDKQFIIDQQPSICYLELFALVTAVLIWGSDKRLCNTRVSILCDNEGVVHMINSMTGKCPHSMKLIRLLALDNLKFNRRIFVKHISSQKNYLADSLSRLDFCRFWRLAPTNTSRYPDCLPTEIWPMQKVW